MQQPNILFLMGDQHTARLMGCAGAPFVRTSNLDRLAAQGVRFANAYYHKQGMELFDLATDPGELNNLADDPAYTAARTELWTMLTHGWEPDEIDRRVRLDQEYRTLVGQSLARQSTKEHTTR